ncbi:hypothetical protein HMPREF1556_01705 [Porphyromonas sp. oral taxon 278 str. W7784]|nr:hypothetical protein HMPREF1556_01705 [Porphyromonas sp. oral taxon 278 str. W7784]
MSSFALPIKCGRRVNRVRGNGQYLRPSTAIRWQGKRSEEGEKRRCRGKGFPRHRAVDRSQWERP